MMKMKMVNWTPTLLEYRKRDLPLAIMPWALSDHHHLRKAKVKIDEQVVKQVIKLKYM